MSSMVVARLLRLDMLDNIEEVAPTSGGVLSILDFLRTEIVHSNQVVIEFLALKGWNGDLSQIND